MKNLTIALSLFIILAANSLNAQLPQIKWWYDVNDASFGNSSLADLDMDGKPEICFGTYRNDSMVHVLNAENGSLLWKYNTGGCNDAGPLIIDADLDGYLEVIVASSCTPKTFCFKGADGSVLWMANTHGSDSPPSSADVDQDGKPEILHGEFGGWVICLNGENGSQSWEIPVDLNSWIQTEPAILDVDNDAQLDFVVANWSFGTSHKIFCYRGDNHQLLWESSLPTDVMYHGAAFADIDKDGFMELTIGSYNGYLYCLNAENGSKKWDFAFPSPFYIGAPSSIGDLDNDGWADIIFFDAWKIGMLDRNGTLKWQYTIPSNGQSFRGAALVDMNSDDTLDVVFGTSTGHLMVLNGSRGNLLFDVDLQSHMGTTDFEIDHGPVVADFDGDGHLDVFLVGGHAEYPNIQNNYGRAYAVSFPSSTVNNYAAPWPMFRHDIRRSGSVYSSGVGIPAVPSADAVIDIFPNPSQGSFWVQSSNDIDLNSFRFFNLNGQEISHSIVQESEGKFRVSIDDPGIYLLRFLSSGQMRTMRCIVLP